MAPVKSLCEKSTDCMSAGSAGSGPESRLPLRSTVVSSAAGASVGTLPAMTKGISVDFTHQSRVGWRHGHV